MSDRLGAWLLGRPNGYTTLRASLARGDLLNTLEDALYRGQIERRQFLRLALAAGASLATAQSIAQEGGDAAKVVERSAVDDPDRSVGTGVDAARRRR